jgi:GNAT superfamily N-acetyltransferase
MTIPRNAVPEETGCLAELWRKGWRDAHAEIVPAELVRLRTKESFHQRMRAAIADVRVIGEVGAPLGFHLIKEDELNQFYVAPSARGTGVAATLLADAERQLAARGVKIAWLACAIGNRRAARFYEKGGWRMVSEPVIELETAEAVFAMRVWRYEKRL